MFWVGVLREEGRARILSGLMMVEAEKHDEIEGNRRSETKKHQSRPPQR